jgi:hypothetical protein
VFSSPDDNTEVNRSVTIQAEINIKPDDQWDFITQPFYHLTGLLSRKHLVLPCDWKTAFGVIIWLDYYILHNIHYHLPE